MAVGVFLFQLLANEQTGNLKYQPQHARFADFSSDLVNITGSMYK
jgi:hypothetical protein